MELLKKIGKVVSYVKSAYGNTIGNWTIIGNWDVFSWKREKLEGLMNGYVTNDDVYAVINRLANVASSIPIKVQRYNNETGAYEDIPFSEKNKLVDLLKKPNKNQTIKEYLVESLIMFLLSGNLFEWVRTPVGFSRRGPQSLKVVPSQYTDVIAKDENNFFSDIKGYEFTWCDQKTKFDFEEIIHTINFDPTYPTDRKGLSFLQPSYKTLSTSNQIHEAEESMIKNRGANLIVSSGSKDGFPLKEAEKEQIDNAFKDRAGGASNYNKTLTVSGNVQVAKMGDSIKDLMLTEIDVAKLRKFCTSLGLPSELFNDPSGSTYNNVLEAKQSLYTDSAIPLLQKKIDAWNENLVPIFNNLDNAQYIIILDTSKIEVLQANKKEEAEKNAKTSKAISGIAVLVSKGELDRDSAINILVYTYGMSIEDAEKLIPNINTNGQNE